ncbi:glycoside hydrolase [Dyella nitratireducens]|uniref:Endo-beta-1,6-galactanase-like domain-containing protein n=1 Tax=Dyella nitratireducens TaxID=1849580 RepID=A0ABQ1FM03_9GAMM|nr:glycoside hydrolase [Dyella nitratireducens]GGA19653.1 hypothetical protein GCM10010981_04570 [Dyella nitratireducens]GLQ44481.1 hypothetical protein GCM10007902_43310 [Dyella nitratireducens]
MRRLWIAVIAAACLFASIHSDAQTFAAEQANGIPEARINTGKIIARPQQTLRGWGMSLAWEANDLYGGDRQPAQIKNPKIQSDYMDLLYGDPASRLTLGFTIARYNIAGGDDPSHTHMRPDAQLEGYQSGPAAPFDWNRDVPQRKMLQEAKKRGAAIFEAASYSPPYWMTLSGCSSGSKDARQDNLRPDMQESFVNYLATVVKHFRDAEGIVFESVEPFNEPDGGWRAGGSQEGYAASIATQNAVIPMLANRLKHDGLQTVVAGVDANNISAAISMAGQLNPDAVEALGRFDTHDYHHAVDDLAKLGEYKTLGEKRHTSIWMSELGCCFKNQNEKDAMWGALFMADSIRMDLRDLGAEAWILWQPDWEVIAFDPNGGEPQLKKQYYAIGQYSRFIRPGFQIISAGGAYHTLAAYSQAAKRLVLVTTNDDAPGSNDLDLTAFTGLPRSVQVYRTTADETVNLREEKATLSSNGHLIDPLPAHSITTYVVDGVTPRPDASADVIAGTHPIVAQATGRCMNIVTNATQPGAAIIPYACGAYGNEVFNFVDRGGGFYAIQTVNGLENLCLNISNGTGSPGDGRTRGGPGNLIQWNCGEASLPANELFHLEAIGTDTYRIHVKNSGLCLEEPGGASTIRQNRCNAASPNQVFKLGNT